MSTEREQRYAEAISEASGIAAHRPQVLKEAGAVMAVADAEIEQAEGRVAEWRREAVAAEAEVARLTRLLEQRTAALTRTIDAKNAAEAEVERLRGWIDRSDRMQRRAEAAEALVARAEALPDEWFDEDAATEHVVACSDYACKDCVVIACATDLRAALNEDRP